MDRAHPADGPEDERSLRAAEIALRLVDGPARREMLRRDPAMAREVAAWEDEFARLADELQPVAPFSRARASLMERVSAKAEGAEAGAASWSARFRTLYESLALWRVLAGAGLSAAAVLLALLLQRAPEMAAGPVPPSAEGGTVLVSSLLPRDGPPVYIAAYDAARSSILVVPAAARPASDRFPQLWLVPNDDGEPIALGSVDPERPIVIVLAPEAAAQADARSGLVITLEPNGAPAGATAQGPVVAHGLFVTPPQR